MSKFIYLACICGLAFFIASCSGSECAASSNFVTDIDSDCVEDSADNCGEVYNPDQFDGDEDNIGYACDTDDTVDGSVSAPVTLTAAFNIAGYYEFENTCAIFFNLRIEQAADQITAIDESENFYEGTLVAGTETGQITGTLTGRDQICDFTYHVAENTMDMNCGCEFSGKKLFTHLRIE